VLNAVTYPLDDVQLAVSKAVVDSVPRRFGRRLRVMHQGIDVQAERAALAERDAARAELGLQTQDVVVGTVANYREQKDYPNLFAAARRVLAERKNVRFVAIGQGPQEAEIAALLADEEFGDRLQLLGRRDDVSHVLAACDLFVLASKNEGLPIALVEALALGLPVVATAVGGTPEVVTDGLEGLLVPPSNPEQLASAIGRLVADPELRVRMSAAATERSGHFDISRAVGETEAVYRALTSDSR
jgi:glycosyltransferase involved in cell wall biosynthesis